MPQPEVETWSVSEDDAGERVDKYLATFYDEYSRVQIQRNIRDCKVTIKRQGAYIEKVKIGETLFANDEISYEHPLAESSELKAEKVDLEIIFEDEYILVINKAAGMVVHPGAGVHDGTLVNALLGYSEETFRPMDEEGRPGIVHRLDKETSGVLIIAKNQMVKTKLSKKFAKRQVDKLYLALVRGIIRMGKGSLETYIGRSKMNRQKMMSYDEEEEKGKHAVTHYKVLTQNKGTSLVKVKIETGRTHQIRVHMSEMGFPVIGDKIYGKRRIEMNDSPERHLLHAWRLKITHPVTQKEMVFTAPIPQDFHSVLDKFNIDIEE